MAASDVTSLETNFFRIAGTSEAETSVSGNAEFLIATGEEKNNNPIQYIERLRLYAWKPKVLESFCFQSSSFSCQDLVS